MWNFLRNKKSEIDNTSIYYLHNGINEKDLNVYSFHCLGGDNDVSFGDICFCIMRDLLKGFQNITHINDYTYDIKEKLEYNRFPTEYCIRIGNNQEEILFRNDYEIFTLTNGMNRDMVKLGMEEDFFRTNILNIYANKEFKQTFSKNQIPDILTNETDIFIEYREKHNLLNVTVHKQYDNVIHIVEEACRTYEKELRIDKNVV